jgi:putative transposase
MRIARRDLIGESGMLHKIWRGHNREHVMKTDGEKRAYLRHLVNTYTDEINSRVKWHSYSVMGNHSHEGNSIVKLQTEDWLKEGIRSLGNWMRNGHSRFGSEYNRRNNRQGKVAYDRPKTIEVKDDASFLKVMFYGDANPVKAGIVSHPRQYRYSSYRFYAYGEINEYTRHLTPPPSYLLLGDTPQKRQKKYRSLCDKYLREAGLIDDTPPIYDESAAKTKLEPNHLVTDFRNKGDPSES